MTYVVTVLGEATLARARLADQPWVRSVTASPNHQSTTLKVGVTAEGMAQSQLLRLVLEDPEARVTQFGRQEHHLEDVFVQIVEGGDTHDH